MGTNPSLQQLVGMSVSHVFFSDYSICYIELGALSAGRVLPNGRTGNPRGEATVFLGYDWLAMSGSLAFSRLGLHVNPNERNALEANILGGVIESASSSDTGLEIEIGLSNGVMLMSVSPNDEEPSWQVVFDDCRGSTLGIEDGKLQIRTKMRWVNTHE